jgi:2-keto-4-pentenoate hydratase
LDEAYAVQMEVARLRCEAGDAVVGYKVGCIGPGVVEQFGMSGPIHARLFRGEIRNSGETLQYDAYANLAIEGEMAVRVATDGAIDAAFPVIELHHFVFRGPRKTLAELVANNGINAGAVISNRRAAMTLDDWAAARTLSVVVNGVTIDAGALWAMRGGAAEAIEWLRGDLRRFGASLKPGDLVLAGTPLGLNPLKPGDHVMVMVDDKKCVECRIS